MAAKFKLGELLQTNAELVNAVITSIQHELSEGEATPENIQVLTHCLEVLLLCRNPHLSRSFYL